MTPKQKVLKRWPHSYSKRLGNGWHIYTLSRPSRIEVEIGTGLSAADAWANAEKHTRGDRNV